MDHCHALFIFPFVANITLTRQHNTNMGFVKKIKSSRSVASMSKSTTKQKSKKFTKSMPAKFSSSVQPVIDEDEVVESFVFSKSISLASGCFSSLGVSSIALTSTRHLEVDSSITTYEPSVFIRTADLTNMLEAASMSRHSSFSELAENELIDHIHKPSSVPPLPSIEHDPNECWVALDDGDGNKAPLAEAALASLVKTALDASMDEQMWTANGGTPKILKTGMWDETIFLPFDEKRPVPVPHSRGDKGELDVLVWSGSWSHKYYGHELPCIRCEAIVNMGPRALVDLLVDSTRVKEYNKMSIGRDDMIILQEDVNCVTKINIGKSKPPMLGRTLMLKSLLHMEELPGGGQQAGYVIVSRAIAHADDDEAAEDPKIIHSEMLMGVNIIRAVEGDPDRCLLININHLRIPMIPMMFAKKLGVSSAVNFINDIRQCCVE